MLEYIGKQPVCDTLYELISFTETYEFEHELKSYLLEK